MKKDHELTAAHKESRADTTDRLTFTAGLDFSDISASGDSASMDHKLFTALNGVLGRAVEALENFYINEIFRTRRNNTNPRRMIALEKLANQLLSLAVHFMPGPTLDDPSLSNEIASDLILNAIEILVLERHYPSVSYVHTPTINIPYIVSHDRDGTKIHYRHESLTNLANKIELALFSLYEINPDLYIEITIGNESITLIGLPPTTKRQTVILSGEAEIFEGTIFNGRQSDNPVAFLVKLHGTNKSLQLYGVDNENAYILKRKAKYNDRIRFTAYRCYRNIRGTRTRTDRLWLEKILSDLCPGQNSFTFVA